MLFDHILTELVLDMVPSCRISGVWPFRDPVKMGYLGYAIHRTLGIWDLEVPNKTFARACDRGIYAIYTLIWDPSDGREGEYDPQNMYGMS